MNATSFFFTQPKNAAGCAPAEVNNKRCMSAVQVLFGVWLLLVLLTLWQINHKMDVLLDDFIVKSVSIVPPDRNPTESLTGLSMASPSVLSPLSPLSPSALSPSTLSPGLSLSKLGIQPVLIPFRPILVPDYLRQRNFEHLNHVAATVEEQNKWNQLFTQCVPFRQYLYTTSDPNKYEYHCGNVPVLTIWRDPVSLDWDYQFQS